MGNPHSPERADGEWTTAQAAAWCGLTPKAFPTVAARSGLAPTRWGKPCYWASGEVMDWWATHRLRRLRWPLQPLLDAAGLTQAQLAQLVQVPAGTVANGRRGGLTDTRADQWATRVGLHPVTVWGWAWIDAALDPACSTPAETGTNDGDALETVA